MVGDRSQNLSARDRREVDNVTKKAVIVSEVRFGLLILGSQKCRAGMRSLRVGTILLDSNRR